ncbi:MAG TPA: class I SAM-dependent rRNA methyltransferase [Bacteroidia bacterium]|nr:class I SAM-dependent rRNA methyltransferase [Bacteroidia bacterium]
MEKFYPKIILKKGKERSLQNFHPWLFSGAVEKQDKELTEGCVAEIFSNDDKYLATAHFHHGSIVARVLSFEKCEIDQQFFDQKIQKAFELRKHLRLTDSDETTVYRLINAEGDGLPGLIVDIYNNTAVIQTHTAGMFESKDFTKNALLNIPGLHLKAVYDKSANSMEKHSGIESKDSYLFGEKENNIVAENGIKFSVDWKEGQKTGFFIDQRENRKLLMHYSKNKKVLNTFAYSGGFSLYALQAGAALVHSVDSSKKAMEWANENVDLNFQNALHEYFALDTFDFLKRGAENYDVIILDPPSFAKHLSAVDKATIGYRNLNYEAIKRINKNGILFTFSCSQAIDKNLFRKIVFMAAAQAKRNVKVLHQLSQAPDHPVSIYHPEGEYLKGLVLYVE